MGGIGVFLRDAWRLARPYFADSDERWSARGLFAAVLALNLASVGMTVLFNFWRADFFNAIETKDWDSFLALLLTWRANESGLTAGFAPLAFAFVGIAIYEVYLNQLLQIRWRRWMIRSFLDAWLDGRAYYKIGIAPDRAALGTDNPDQRIAEDIRDFCASAMTLALGLVSRATTLLSFLAILWGLSGTGEIFGVPVPGYLFWIALAYAIAGTAVVHRIGRPLAELAFRQQRVEADFRYALVRLRENAEGVALLRGEAVEKAALLRRFGAVIGNWRDIMTRTKRMNIAALGYGQAAEIFPIVLIAPRYFAGQSTMGQLFQTVDAFARVQESLSWAIDVYKSLAQWRAVVSRLATFQGAVEAARTDNGGFEIAASADGGVRASGLTVALPGGAALLRDTSAELPAGRSVAVTGPSGSSL